MDDGVEWVTISDLSNEKTIYKTAKKISPKYISEFKPITIPEGSLLYSFKLSVGQVGFAGKEIYSNEAIAAFLKDKTTVLEFLYYSSSLIVMNANENIYGAKLLNQELIKNAFITYPPFKEQLKIANYLDTRCSLIDQTIEKQKKVIRKLKEYKQSVITEAVTRGLISNVLMKDSGSDYWGEVPDDWSIKKLKYVFSIVKRIAGQEGYDVLSITQNGIRVKDLSNNEGQIAQDYSNYQLVEVGDFAMNHMDLLTGWVDVSKYNGVTSPDYRVFKIDDEKVCDRRYYLHLMQTCYRNKIFYGLGQGVSSLGRWRLQADKFLNFLIPVPNIEEQKAIAAYIDDKCIALDNAISIKENVLDKLESYKKSLIYECVTGKREVM